MVPAISVLLQDTGRRDFRSFCPLRESRFDYDHSLKFYPLSNNIHFCKERLPTVHPKTHERGTCDVVSLCRGSTCQTRQAQGRKNAFRFRDPSAIIEKHSRGLFVVHKWRLQSHQIVETFKRMLRPAGFRFGWRGLGGEFFLRNR